MRESIRYDFHLAFSRVRLVIRHFYIGGKLFSLNATFIAFNYRVLLNGVRVLLSVLYMCENLAQIVVEPHLI